MTSAELITELQAARPAADGVLRDRIRTLAATEPERRPSPFSRLSRFSPRRFALVGVPAAAVVLLGLAGIAGLLDFGSRPQAVATGRADSVHPSTSTGSVAGVGPTASGGATASGSATTSGGATAVPGLAASTGGGPVQALAPELKAGATTASDAATPAPTAGRAQRYSAQLTLSVKDIDALSNATQQALQITRDLGGYLVTASYATSDTGVSSLTLKVPTVNVQDAIVRLSGLGKIVAQQVQIDDLQGQVDELTKRETVLREQIARLSARLAASGLDAETEATLQARRDAARSALTQVRVARGQVNAEARYATILLSVQTRQSAVVPVVPSHFDRALDRAVEILALEAMIVLYALVIVGPLALLTLVAWFSRRGLRRKQDEQLLSTP
jgi:Domain of unknown function (DUF4349)